jgi:hypothetical protein
LGLSSRRKYNAMNEKEQREKEADLDNDQISDQKTRKDREWDDWKDLHDNGSANTNDKRI